MEVLQAAREAQEKADAEAAQKLRACERSVRMQARERKRAIMLSEADDEGDPQHAQAKRRCEEPCVAEGEGGAEEGGEDMRSFVAYREARPGVVWVDEVHTAEGERRKGVATWMIGAVGMGKRVEMQVRQGAEGAQQAYTRMGMCGVAGIELCCTANLRRGMSFGGHKSLWYVRDGIRSCMVPGCKRGDGLN